MLKSAQGFHFKGNNLKTTVKKHWADIYPWLPSTYFVVRNFQYCFQSNAFFATHSFGILSPNSDLLSNTCKNKYCFKTEPLLLQHADNALKLKVGM